MASPTVERASDAKQQETSKTSSPPHRLAQIQTTEPEESPKRKNSEANNTGAHDNNGDHGKKKRRKVNHACVYCRRSHMTCDLERPCARCIKRDIGHLCHDEPRDPPKRSKSDVGVAEIAPAPGDGLEVKREISSSNGKGTYAQANGDLRLDGAAGGAGGGGGGGAATVPGSAIGGPAIAQPTPMSPGHLQRPPTSSSASNHGGNYSQAMDWNNHGVHNQFQDMHHLHPNYMFNTSEATSEYNLLNDFLSTSLLDDGGMYNDDTQALFSDPLLATSSMNALAMSLPNTNAGPSASLPASSAAHTQAGHEISRPSSTYPVDSRARDKFYMTAADPAGLSSAEDRLHKLLRAKYDAGMLKPFNYVKGYARLNAYMSSHLSRGSQLRILKQLERFRPKFREAMQTLTDMQLVLVEMWFERKLMVYDRVFASMAIPACCWRRTGEIFRGNTEMAALIRCPLETLRDGKLAIHEVIAEDSLVSYWEKFGAIAFDNSQKAILTSCSLKVLPEAGRVTNGNNSNSSNSNSNNGGGKGAGGAGDEGQRNGDTRGEHSETNGNATAAPPAAAAAAAATAVETVRCCFSFTIRRDSHNM